MENELWDYVGNFAVMVAYPGNGDKLPDIISNKHGRILKAYRHRETGEVKFYEEKE